MSDAIIQIEDLKKAYANGVEALKGVEQAHAVTAKGAPPIHFATRGPR